MHEKTTRFQELQRVPKRVQNIINYFTHANDNLLRKHLQGLRARV